jgi:hypothetical protein
VIPFTTVIGGLYGAYVATTGGYDGMPTNVAWVCAVIDGAAASGFALLGYQFTAWAGGKIIGTYQQSFLAGKIAPSAASDALPARPTVTLYHHGDLSGGIDGSRYLSTSPSPDLGQYNPGGQLYEFQVPADVLYAWEGHGWITRPNDFHEPSGIYTPEIRIWPPASGQLGPYLK